MGIGTKFTDEFKREAVKLATQPRVTVSTVGASAGLSAACCAPG